MEITSIKEYVSSEKKRLKDKVAHSDKEYVLDIFQIGDIPASNAYIRGKMKDCSEIGIKANLHKYSETQFQKEEFTDKLLVDVQNAILNSSNGVIVQLPVPDFIDSKRIIADSCCINKSADVDAFVYDNHNPCTPQGIVDWLEYNNVKLDGANVTIVGRSDIVGKPLARMMTEKNATVTLCHSHTNKDFIQKYCALSDIIVCAVGKPHFLRTASFMNSDKIIVDVGINYDKDGKMCGDVMDNLAYSDFNYYVTPVPGGVGLLTRLRLIKNILGE